VAESFEALGQAGRLCYFWKSLSSSSAFGVPMALRVEMTFSRASFLSAGVLAKVLSTMV
jgi:hypothetical protein